MPKSFTLSFLLIEDSLNLWFCIEVMSRFSLSKTSPNTQKGENFHFDQIWNNENRGNYPINDFILQSV